MGKKHVLLGGLLVICVVLFVYRLLTPPEQKRVKELTFPPQGRVQGNRPSEEARIFFDLLEKPHEKFKGASRDIFLPLKEKKPASSKDLIVEVVPEKKAPEFKFLGFLADEGGKSVFLARDQDVFSVKKGDVIEKKYTVRDITPSYVLLYDQIRGKEIRVEVEK